MENGVDFEYEYSDLNLLKTRVKVLTGVYAGLVFEYGGSMLAQWEDKNMFTFEYTLYEVPEPFKGPALRKEASFNAFIAYLIVDVIKARREDSKEVEKRNFVLHGDAPKRFANIHINNRYYTEGAK